GLLWRMLWLQPETSARAAASAAVRAIAFIAYSSMSAVTGPKAIVRRSITPGRNLRSGIFPTARRFALPIHERAIDSDSLSAWRAILVATSVTATVAIRPTARRAHSAGERVRPVGPAASRPARPR